MLGEQTVPGIERSGGNKRRSASMPPSQPTSWLTSPSTIGPTTPIAGFLLAIEMTTAIAVNAMSGANAVAHDAPTSATAFEGLMSWPVSPVRD